MRILSYKIFFCISVVFCIDLCAQVDIQTKEVIINSGEGKEVFNICIKNPEIKTDSEIFYSWYKDSKHRGTTLGKFQGNLLHGSYQMFDLSGHLIKQQNYHLGVFDGMQKVWTDSGEIYEVEKYDQGFRLLWRHRIFPCLVIDSIIDTTYTNGKNIHSVCIGFQDEEDILPEGDETTNICWIEHSQIINKGAMTYKWYTIDNVMMKEVFATPKFNREVVGWSQKYSGKWVTEYYANGKKKSNYFMVPPYQRNCKMGSYKIYYKNGKLKCEGIFYDALMDGVGNLRDGKWIWYNQNGTVVNQLYYKVETTKWDNGQIKNIGSLVSPTGGPNDWKKTGIWYEFDEQVAPVGEIKIPLSYKEYKNGVELTK